MESQKKQMMKRQFRIGDLAKELKVKKFVIRFWEKEFDLKSDRSQGGQRFYTDEDLDVFLAIKDLLYNQGFTIAGAKKQLPEALSGARRILNDDLMEENFVVAMSPEEAIDGNNECEESDACSDSKFVDAEERVQSVERSMDSLQSEEISKKTILNEKDLCKEAKPTQEVFDESVACLVQNEPRVYLQAESLSVLEEVSALSDNNSKTCIPARIAADSSFYEDLAILKGQLARLYELLD